MKPLFHNSFSLVIASLVAMTLLAFTQEPEAQPLDDNAAAIIAELSSDEFQVRESATIKLWNMGDRAEPLVRQLAATGEPEVRARATKLLALFKYGIFPTTPAEIVTLINQFRHGDFNTKINAIQQLYSLGEIAAVAKLIRSIDDPNARRNLVRSVVDELDEKLAALFAEEKYEAVEALLVLAAISDEGLRDLAAFHFQSGSLDHELTRLTTLQNNGEISPIESEQLAWLYRMKGDLDSALTAANNSKNNILINSIRIAQGDLLTLIKTSHNPNDRTIQTFGFKAASQRLSGDSDGFNTTIETIKKYATENPREVSACLDALMINGATDAALEIAEPGSTERLQLLIDSGQHLKALAELGINNPTPPYNEWLLPILTEFKASENAAEYSQALGKAYTLSRLLKGWGEDAEASRIFDQLGAAATKSNAEFLSRLIANASVLGLNDVALKYSKVAFANAAADAAADANLDPQDLEEQRIRNLVGQRGEEESIISALYYNNSDAALFWWGRLENSIDSNSTTERLELLNLLLGYQDGKSAEAIELLKKLYPKENEEIDPEDLSILLTHISSLYLLHNDQAAAMEFLKKSLEPGRPDAIYVHDRYGSMLIQDDKWQEALPHLKLAAENEDSSSYFQIRYGIALEKTGHPEEAAATIKRARLSALGRPIEYRRIAAAFASLGEYDRAREASQIVVNIALADDTTVHAELPTLADLLAPDNPAAAALYKERYLIECLSGHIQLTSLSNAASIRGSIGTFNARIAIADGRIDEAVAILDELITHQPSNSSLLEDLYPILVQSNRKTEADDFYNRLNQYGEDALAIFPNSAQDLNSNAWLKSRCGKDLDTALKRSQLSNQLSKDNFAYLDTLAEVHFQRGERELAIELSEKAVTLSGADFLLSTQLQRFKNQKPLSELLPSQ